MQTINNCSTFALSAQAQECVALSPRHGPCKAEGLIYDRSDDSDDGQYDHSDDYDDDDDDEDDDDDDNEAYFVYLGSKFPL